MRKFLLGIVVVLVVGVAIIFGFAALVGGGGGNADEASIGSVSTNFRLFGPNDRVVVERIPDPKVANVVCYASFAQTGGVAGGLGVATDPSQFALNCIGHGAVSIPSDLPQQEEMGAISASFLFKHFIITRMVDTKDNTLVYVLISTKVLHGSPANAVSAVAAGS